MDPQNNPPQLPNNNGIDGQPPLQVNTPAPPPLQAAEPLRPFSSQTSSAVPNMQQPGAMVTPPSPMNGQAMVTPDMMGNVAPGGVVSGNGFGKKKLLLPLLIVGVVMLLLGGSAAEHITQSVGQYLFVIHAAVRIY